ncbi:hypothetical protein PENSPDRAFT_97461 [Peniophora sp. CONT]|nr:hypothetical protein PENSPDRAFT_97461 [Peniophora sp. CONT]
MRSALEGTGLESHLSDLYVSCWNSRSTPYDNSTCTLLRPRPMLERILISSIILSPSTFLGTVIHLQTPLLTLSLVPNPDTTPFKGYQTGLRHVHPGSVEPLVRSYRHLPSGSCIQCALWLLRGLVQDQPLRAALELRGKPIGFLGQNFG